MVQSPGLTVQVCLTLGLVLASAGCGGTSGLVNVEGAVAYDNAPVEKGMITFTPTTEGKQVRFAEIKQGRYEMKGELAPQPGTYSVVVEGLKKVSDPRVPDYAKDENGMVEKQYLPDKYNKKSELTIEIKEGQSQYDFNLEK